MKISPKLKSDIQKVAVITIVFVLLDWFLTLYNHAFINTEFSNGPSDIYDINLNLIMNTITGIFAGILGGSALIYINNKYFRKRSYGYALSATFVGYSLVFIVVTILVSFLTAIVKLGLNAGYSELYHEASRFFASLMALVYYLFWGIVSMLTLFFLQINDKFGPGMLAKFLTGTYHSPKDEERIFMFMDMKSSTTIAEKIGSKKYFNLLNDLYDDVTDAILSTEGEIYQYIGDEIVVSWSLHKGIRQINCLKCFQSIRLRLGELKPIYLEKYGLVPEFKAGVHYGLVTAGEMGSIKKDIAFSGDVLNTTSRIQEQCNFYKVDFLVSKETLDLLGNNNPYEPVHLGKIELRGKQARIDLNTLKVA